MFLKFCKLLAALAVIAPGPVLADIIHWELHSEADAPSYLGQDFLLTGGFDFDTETKAISNITVKTSAVGCVACNDFSGGGVGEAFMLPDGRGGVNFIESYFDADQTLRRDYFLQIAGSSVFGQFSAFDVSQPNSYQDLSLWHHGWVKLDDPLDPDIYEETNCDNCVSAVSTLTSPVPEPETYGMLLGGLGMLGWQVKRKARR